MNKPTNTQNAASPGTEESPNQSSLSDAEKDEAFLAALAAEGYPPESDEDEGTPAAGSETEEEAAAEATESEEERSAEDSPDGQAEEDADDPEEGSEEEPEEPAEEEVDEEEQTDLDSIPEEYQQKVGALIKRTRDKERAKAAEAAAKLAELQSSDQEIRQQLADLESERDELKGAKTVPARTAANPYADVMSVEDLRTAEDELWDVRKRLMTDRENIEIADPKAEGGKRYLTEREVNERLAVLDQRLQRDLPARRRWLEDREREERELSTTLPDLGKRGSPLATAVNKVLATHPGLKTTPGHKRAAAAMALGEKLLENHGKEAWTVAANKRPAAPAKPAATGTRKPPPPPRASSTPARPTNPHRKERISDEEFADLLLTR